VGGWICWSVWSVDVNEDAYLLPVTQHLKVATIRYVTMLNGTENVTSLDWDEVQKTAAELAEADELLFRVDICETAGHLQDNCPSEAFYDFGHDIGKLPHLHLQPMSWH
jgi:hypothetical protein